MFTRPNISYAVNKVCQFMHAPTKSHWVAIKLILRYLKATSFFGLYRTHASSLSLHGVINVDWVESIDDRKSIGGYIVFLGTTLILWKFRKQHTIARFSIEVKYKALSDGTVEVL